MFLIQGADSLLFLNLRPQGQKRAERIGKDGGDGNHDGTGDSEDKPVNTDTVPFWAQPVPKSDRDVFRLSDGVRLQAAKELEDALEGISGKRIRAAGVPGAGVAFLSGAKNGSDGNPFYRAFAVLLLMRRVGASQASAERLVMWLYGAVQWLWSDESSVDVGDMLGVRRPAMGVEREERQPMARRA